MKTVNSIQNYIYRSFAVLMLWTLLPTTLKAQSVEVFDIVQSGTGAVMKARIDTNGKTVGNVVTRTFRMSDGYSTTRSDYKIYEDRYIIASLDYMPGDYFYRMEVTFDDGSVTMTDCFNAALTEGAVWLSDLPVTNATCTPSLDICSNGAPILLDGVTYYKGISARPSTSTDYIEYTLPRTFSYVRFVMGVQDVKADGSASVGNARIETYANGASTDWKGFMLAKSNPGCSVCKFDARWPRSGTMNMTSIKFVLNNRGDSTDDDCNLAAARLYYPVSVSDSRTPQTVTFENESGYITEDAPLVELKATASGGTPVYYNIVDGADIATIENGNILVPTPGKKGNIVVEAFTFGDDSMASGSASISFSFNFAPTVAFLATYPQGADKNVRPYYLFIDTKDKTLEGLTLTVYDNIRDFNQIAAINVMPLLSSAATIAPNVFEVPVPAAAGNVYRLAYRFAGEERVEEPLAEGLEPFAYMSDLPYAITTGWGSPSRDNGYGDNGRLANSLYTYGKGFGFHAVGYVATTGDLSAFDRFVAEVGGQKITNNTRGRLSFSLQEGSAVLANTGNVAWNNVAEWNVSITGKASIRINGGNGDDGNTNDVIAIGAPRFYYIHDSKESQSISWDTTPVAVANYKPFEQELDARASSGLPVIYRIVDGTDIAEIKDGNKIRFNSIPAQGTVVVEALQPGDRIYAPADIVTRTFSISKELIIARDERVEIDGGYDIDRLTVYADAQSSGQAIVRNGVVNVRSLVLKYTFVPGEWNYLSFPTDLDLNAISDLNEKGFYLNNTAAGRGAYSIQAYDTRAKADNPDESPWYALETSMLKGLKGYIMMLDSSLGTEPVEITFTIDNMSLDFESTIRPLHLTVDMTHVEPGTVHPVYIKPTNVKGNTLKVNVRFDPTDESALPVNHAKALDAMRVTYSPNRKGIRLTLPDQTPAKVALFGLDDMHLVKAVRYVSPIMIDISDIPSGFYRLVVGYGPATTTRIIEL